MHEAQGQRYLQAKALAHSAAELSAEQREGFLRERTGGDADLAADASWMLAAMEITDAGLTCAGTLALDTLIPSDTVDLCGAQAQATAPRNYHVLRRLGEGGMGVVYLAERRDGGFTQQVALKFIHASAENSPAMLQRFAHERELLARLEHPGIARLLDGGLLADGRSFLALEYVHGERIDDWCDRQQLDLRGRIAVFLKVCEAVDHAHRHLIIHRDLNPANILVAADGNPKLLDFGVARLLGGAPEAAAGAVSVDALTLAYASPEQIEQRTLTTAADVYSLGVVLYRLLAGRRPFQHLATPQQLSDAVLGGEVPPPSRAAQACGDGERPSRIPADLDAIVLKAMQRQPESRYGGVRELTDDLRRFLDRRPVHARRLSVAYRGRRYVRRHRLAFSAAAVVMLSIVFGLVFSLHALAQARTQQQLAILRQRELERAVAFQQSVLESVDINAMGHAMASNERRLLAALHAGSVVPDALDRIGFSDLAREALDAHVVSHALDGIDARFADEPLLGAALRQSLARVLATIGSYRHATQELRKVLAVRQRRLPADDPAILSVKADLAQTLDQAHELGAAASAYDEALGPALRLPVADPQRVAIESGRARVLSDAGRLRAAADEQLRLYTELQPLLPATDRGLLRLRRDRVVTLVRLGLRDEARAAIEPLAALYRRALGPTDPETLDALFTQAQLLNYSNEYERSLALAREVAAVHQRRLGSEHPTTLRDLDMVAANLVRLERMDEARPLLQRVIDARSRLLGADNPDTLDSMTTMVRLLAGVDAWPQAAALQRTILVARSRVLGADHPDTLFARASLAGFLARAHRYDEALAEATGTLAAQRRTLGADHPIVFATLDLIARIDAAAGRWRAASAAHAEALAGRDRILGRMDAHTLESATRLYGALRQLGDHADMTRLRERYLDPLVAMNPALLNTSMREMRAGTVALLAGAPAR